MTPLEILVLLVTLVFVVVMSEILRTIAARALKLPRPRQLGMLRVLPMTGSTGKRLVVLFAGPVGVYLAIVVIAFVMFRCQGVPTGRTFIGGTVDGSPTDGKLLANDRIIAVDGESTPNLNAAQLSQRVNAKAGAQLTLTVARGGQQLEIVVEPISTRERYGTVWRLGAKFDYERDRDIGTILPVAFAHPILQIRMLARGFVDILTGEEEADPGGPVRIVTELRRNADTGIALHYSVLLGIYTLLAMLAFDFVRAIIVIVQGRRPPPIPRAAVQ